MVLTQAPEERRRRVSRRGWLLFAVAAAAVITATVVGIRGLLASPVQGVSADGITTLQGTWEPYSCTPVACQGYIQAGARSVFVVFPANCPVPVRAAELVLHARPDRTLGNGSYRALACAP